LASGYGVELVSALGVWLLAFGRDFSLLDRLAPPTDAGTCTSEAAGGWPAYFTPDGLVLWASYPPLEFAHKLRWRAVYESRKLEAVGTQGRPAGVATAGLFDDAASKHDVVALTQTVAWSLEGSLASEARPVVGIGVCVAAWAPEPIYELSLRGILKDVGKTGPTPISVIFILFSGIWPLTKLLCVLLFWVTPASVLPVGHRGAILHCLHNHGKWSLVEVAVIQLVIVAVSHSPPSSTGTAPPFQRSEPLYKSAAITALAGLLLDASGKAGSRAFSLIDLGLALRSAMAQLPASSTYTRVVEFSHTTIDD
ncbi:hypothetical protein T492DRAFT_879178, partial [Pavlovales sp. CCMP2436]